MESSYKPEGYNSVSPYLVVNGAAATIAFLVEVFGAVKLRQIPNDEGKLIHAEVRIDDTVVMIADGGDGWSPIPGHVHIYVSDVDATYKRAIAAGAMSVQEPIHKKDDEDKRGGVKDAGGTTWWIATKVE
jgi:PhnB protein